MRSHSALVINYLKESSLRVFYNQNSLVQTRDKSWIKVIHLGYKLGIKSAHLHKLVFKFLHKGKTWFIIPRSSPTYKGLFTQDIGRFNGFNKPENNVILSFHRAYYYNNYYI